MQIALMKNGYEGQEIRVARPDEQTQLVCLTDIWKHNDGTRGRNPNKWLGSDDVTSRVKAISSRLKTPVECLLQTTKGRNGGTFAHPHIAMAYCLYLSPELFAWAMEVLTERIEEEANPELGIDRAEQRAIATWKRQGHSDEWIEARLHGRRFRKEFTSVLRSHGVSDKETYRAATEVTYRKVLDMNTADIRKARPELKKYHPARDGLTMEQLAAVETAETIAALNMRRNRAYGDRECLECTREAAEKARVAFAGLV